MWKKKKKSPRGKYVCKKLKEIRKMVAEVIGGDFDDTPCPYEGDCSGTCPKCDAELKELTSLLRKKLNSGALSMDDYLSLARNVGEVILFDDNSPDELIEDLMIEKGIVVAPPELRGKVMAPEDMKKKVTIGGFDDSIEKLAGELVAPELLGEFNEEDIIEENPVNSLLDSIDSLNIEYPPKPPVLPPDCVGGIMEFMPDVPDSLDSVYEKSLSEFLDYLRSMGGLKVNSENKEYLSDWGLLAIKGYLLSNEHSNSYISSIEELVMYSIYYRNAFILGKPSSGKGKFLSKFLKSELIKLSEDDMRSLDIDAFYSIIDTGIRDKNGDIVYSEDAYNLAIKFNELYIARRHCDLEKLVNYEKALKRSALWGRDGEPTDSFDI